MVVVVVGGGGSGHIRTPTVLNAPTSSPKFICFCISSSRGRGTVLREVLSKGHLTSHFLKQEVAEEGDQVEERSCP